jgi:hypothetical protein
MFLGVNMKYFLILNLVFNFASTSAHAGDSELKKKFLSKTKISLGEYERTADSDSKCAAGPLTVFDAGDELQLILGAKALIGSIGKEKSEDKDDGCVMNYESSYNELVVTEKIKEACGKEKSAYNTTLSLQKDKIVYIKEAYSGDKLVDTIKCTIVKK